MTHTKNMTDGKPIRLMIHFALPMLFANVLQLFYAVADAAIIGRLLGVNAFASVGATASLWWLFLSVVLGLTQGFGVEFAQRFGAREYKELRTSIATGIALAAALSILIALIGLFGLGPILRLMHTPGELINGATVYMSVFFVGMPVVFAYNLFGGMLRSLGDSQTPLRAMIVATILNIALDFAFAIPLGILGVALATVVAQAVASIYCFIALKKTGFLQGEGFCLRRAPAVRLLSLGLPLMLRNIIIELGGLIVQRYINGYGENFVAGIAAAKRMYSLLLVMCGAVEAAVATFVAQNFGAGKLERVRHGMHDGLKMMLLSTAVVMAITLPFGRHIMGLLLSGDPAQVAAVLDIATTQLRIFALGLPILSLLFLYRSALQGIGNTIIPMLSGFLELIMRVGTVVCLTPLVGVWGVYLADAAGWIVAASLLAISYVVVMGRLIRKVVG